MSLREKDVEDRGSSSIPFIDGTDATHSAADPKSVSQLPLVSATKDYKCVPADPQEAETEIPSTGPVSAVGVSNSDLTNVNQICVSEVNASHAVTEEPDAMDLLYPPGLHCLLENSQMVVHMGNLRHSKVIDESCLNRMEIIDETRRILFYVEEEQPPDSNKSFSYKLYNKDCQEVIQVYNPLAESCVCCNASWHWVRRCKYQCVVFAPPGIIAGFVRRSQTLFVQEFEILSPQEDVLLVLRGGFSDLEIYTPDLESELGRLSVHGWRGIMHEVRRTGTDYGLTFPMDLDVRVKSVLIGSIFCIHWLYSTKGGRRR